MSGRAVSRSGKRAIGLGWRAGPGCDVIARGFRRLRSALLRSPPPSGRGAPEAPTAAPPIWSAARRGGLHSITERPLVFIEFQNSKKSRELFLYSDVYVPGHLSMPKPDSLQGALDLLVLKILSRQPKLHGYAIMTAIQNRSGDVLRAEEG